MQLGRTCVGSNGSNMRLDGAGGLLRGSAARAIVRPQALGRGLASQWGDNIAEALGGGKKKALQERQRAQQSAVEKQHDAALAAAVPADEAPHAGAAAAGGADAAPLSVLEAVRQARQARQPVAAEYEEIEVEEPVKGVVEYAADARTLLTAPATRKGIAFGAAAFLGATFAVALYRVYLRSQTVEAQRRRTVDRNKQLVQGLSQYLPERRTELTPAVAKRLQRASGFTPVEVFRKYLWFVLRERKFDLDAVADMVALKGALGLSDEEVAEALRERAQRIYDKYGTLMLSTEGMSAAGLQRKATCQALFSKMLYLTEHEPLLAADSDAFRAADLRMIFGATDEDTERLRIVSLVEMDAERLDRLMAGDASASAAADGGATSS